MGVKLGLSVLREEHRLRKVFGHRWGGSDRRMKKIA
jgi:hypothetical protein